MKRKNGFDVGFWLVARKRSFQPGEKKSGFIVEGELKMDLRYYSDNLENKK